MCIRDRHVRDSPATGLSLAAGSMEAGAVYTPREKMCIRDRIYTFLKQYDLTFSYKIIWSLNVLINNHNKLN